MSEQNNQLKKVKKLNILIVEDDKNNLALAQRMLTTMGHNNIATTNGLECLDILRKKPVDIVLMDIQMPQMDGLETTNIIRTNQEFSNIAQIPIIALSAHAAREHKHMALKSGIDHYLTKPFKKAELAQVIQLVSE